MRKIKPLANLIIVLVTIQLQCFKTFSQTDPTHFVIRGTGYNDPAYRELKIGIQQIYSTTGRGLRLTVIRKSDLLIQSDQNYDTYASSVDSDNLATALDAITDKQFGILTSYDAWETQITTALDNAFLRLGLTKAVTSESINIRKPYAAIFEGASNGEKLGKAIEVSYECTVNHPYAEIRGYFHQGSFVATGSAPNALLRPQVNKAEVIVDYAGNVGIGTITPTEKLSVNGTIKAKEVKVETNWSDFVFEEDYKLQPLSEVESFIKENKHLPDIPSETEVKENGVSLGEMDAKLLQKIEELTLYVIEMQKELDVYREKSEAFETRLSKVEK
jgi:hypothetical protein